MRFIDHTSECRVCGSACEMCYRRATVRNFTIQFDKPAKWNAEDAVLAVGYGGGGGGKA